MSKWTYLWMREQGQREREEVVVKFHPMPGSSHISLGLRKASNFCPLMSASFTERREIPVSKKLLPPWKWSFLLSQCSIEAMCSALRTDLSSMVSEALNRVSVCQTLSPSVFLLTDLGESSMSSQTKCQLNPH